MSKPIEMTEQLPESNCSADKIVSELIRHIGEQVKTVRKSQRMSRRELSERSSVSPRYLATLESGEGNLSVGILKKLSLALDTPIELFMLSGDAEADLSRKLLLLFSKADSATKERALALLDSDQSNSRKANRVCLVGLRGAGKSTLGKAVSQQLNVPFIELNHEIEKIAGIVVGEIIALYGQEGYRKLEADAISNVIASHDRVVVAVAGGIVAGKETFNRVLENFNTIWIKASSEEHMDRVRVQGDLRPMEGNPEAMSQLRSILNEREVLYRQADNILDTSGKSVDVSQCDLVALIETGRLLTV